MALTAQQIRNTALDNEQVEEVLGVVFAMAARTVLTEAAGPRRTLALTVIGDPPAAARQWRWLILTAANLTAPPSPAQLATAVAADWSLMAGA